MQRFHAMGTEVAVGLPSLDPRERALAAREVAAIFAEAEARLSRFCAESEIARLNRTHGPTRVSAATFELLVRAKEHVRATGGLFDPGVGASLLALGYDRSFAAGALDADAPPRPSPRGSLLELELDPATCTVVRPPHLAVDLGGIAKGATVDAAARILPSPCFVDAGGDVALRGAGPDGDGWEVEIEDPRDPESTLAVLRVGERAVATSASNRRRWSRGGRLQHHLVDPRTGAPAATDLAQVTVLAASVEHAEVLAKLAFLSGSDEGASTLASLPDVSAVLVREDGSLVFVGSLEVLHA